MSDFSYNSTGINLERGGGKRVPIGIHKWRIITATPTKSKKGYPMVKVNCEIIENPDLVGKRLDHYVTFLPPDHKAAGMAIHFLKVIGQPWEKDFEVTAKDWEGESFMARTEDEPYVSERDGKTYTSSKIAEVLYDEKKEDEIPF